MDFFGNTTPGSQMPMQNETYQPTENAAVQEEKKAPQRNPFAIWEVGGETYRLKLQTAGVKELEAKYKGSIMELMSFKGGMPPLTVMLDVAHTAMKPWTHKVYLKKVPRRLWCAGNLSGSHHTGLDNLKDVSGGSQRGAVLDR